jgi:hypothetical protein
MEAASLFPGNMLLFLQSLVGETFADCFQVSFVIGFFEDNIPALIELNKCF